MAKPDPVSYFSFIEQPDFPEASCLERPELPWVTDDDIPVYVQDKMRQICQACPHERDCLIFALTHSLIDGMWGGTSAQERTQVRRLSLTG